MATSRGTVARRPPSTRRSELAGLNGGLIVTDDLDDDVPTLTDEVPAEASDPVVEQAAPGITTREVFSGGKRWVISRGVEVPAVRQPGKSHNLPFHLLAPGDSFEVTAKDMPGKTPEQIQKAVNHCVLNWLKRNRLTKADYKAVVRRVEDPRTGEFKHVLVKRLT